MLLGIATEPGVVCAIPTAVAAADPVMVPVAEPKPSVPPCALVTVAAAVVPEMSPPIVCAAWFPAGSTPVTAAELARFTGPSPTPPSRAVSTLYSVPFGTPTVTAPASLVDAVTGAVPVTAVMARPGVCAAVVQHGIPPSQLRR